MLPGDRGYNAGGPGALDRVGYNPVRPELGYNPGQVENGLVRGIYSPMSIEDGGRLWAIEIGQRVCWGMWIQLLAFMVACLYFGPESWKDADTGMNWPEVGPWAVGFVFCMAPWLTRSPMGMYAGTFVLVAFWLLVGVLTVTHCFILPHSRTQLSPMVHVPAHLSENVTKANPIALLCFSKAHSLKLVNNIGKDAYSEFLADWLKHDYPEWGISFANWWPPIQILLAMSLYRMYWHPKGLQMRHKMPSSTPLLLDTLDCIVLFGALWDQNPYFWFEQSPACAWSFIAIVGLFWFLTVYHLTAEFDSPPTERPWLGTMRSMCLNVTFFGLRLILRVEAEYITNMMMVKNVLCVFLQFQCCEKYVQELIAEMAVSGNPIAQGAKGDIRSSSMKISNEVDAMDTMLREMSQVVDRQVRNLREDMRRGAQDDTGGLSALPNRGYVGDRMNPVMVTQWSNVVRDLGSYVEEKNIYQRDMIFALKDHCKTLLWQSGKV